MTYTVEGHRTGKSVHRTMAAAKREAKRRLSDEDKVTIWKMRADGDEEIVGDVEIEDYGHSAVFYNLRGEGKRL